MSRSIRDTSALREVSETVLRDAGGVARVVSERWVRGADNVLRQVWGGSSGGGSGGGGGGGTNFAASASPDSVSGARNFKVATTVQTNATTVTATGGTAPYRYQWSGETEGQFIANSPTSATTTFAARDVEPGDTRYASFTCTVTDASGTTVLSNIVYAEASNYGSGANNVLP